GVGDEDAGVIVPRDDVDLLATELGDDRLDARPTLADRGTDRVETLLARRDGDLRPRAGLAGDRLDLDGAAVDLGDLELAEPLEDDLLRRLGADPTKDVLLDLLGLDEVAWARVRLVLTRLLETELDERILDFLDRGPGAEDADLAGLGIDPDVDVLVAG